MKLSLHSCSHLNWYLLELCSHENKLLYDKFHMFNLGCADGMK